MGAGREWKLSLRMRARLAREGEEAAVAEAAGSAALVEAKETKAALALVVATAGSRNWSWRLGERKKWVEAARDSRTSRG